MSAITPDASALQQFLPFIFHQQCLAGVITGTVAGRRAIAGAQTGGRDDWREGLAAALSVDPDSVAICGEGGLLILEAVSVRQPPLRLVETLPSRWGWRLGRRTDEPPINFCLATATPDRFLRSGC